MNIIFVLSIALVMLPLFYYVNLGSVKKFVSLVKDGSFLVRMKDMTILIEKEYFYASNKGTNSTDYLRKQHQ